MFRNLPYLSLSSFVFLTFFVMPVSVSAHVPVIVTQDSLHDIKQVSAPEASQAFYGSLSGFPHTYEIRTKEPFTLHVEVLIPDIESADTIVSGIIIKETGNRGRVEEVARLLARDASWETFYEPWGGDRYRRGGSFEREVEPGVYRIEVSTPDNLSPYVLVIGKEEGILDVGYFETLRRLIEVKHFYGKSAFRIVESPLVYVPLLIIALAIGLFFAIRRWKKKRLQDAPGEVV